MLEFILERYNYWIFIILMMTGLYTVISRGNLVKKIIGLNLFQTSVFIFYISIGKITGGTAPILVGDYGGHHDDHGAGHGEGDGEGHSEGHGDTGDHVENGDHADKTGDGAVLQDHDSVDHHAAVNDLHAGEANDLSAATSHTEAGQPTTDHGDAPAHHIDADANNLLAQPIDDHAGFSTSDAIASSSEGHAVDAAQTAAEVIYTNPLPHVLILTAIVVGVATTSVGLALAVRIREAYGTIEEDELEADDNIAQYGEEAAA